MRASVLALLVAGCTTFEDPAIVLDLRIVAMTASPPEQVIDVDLEAMPDLGELVDQLEPSVVCAHVADPGRSRQLRWTMTACLPAIHENGDTLGVCDPARPSVVLADAIADDPDVVPGPLCAPIEADGNLVAILLDQFENDQLRGFAGLDYTVAFTVGGVDADPALDLVGTKQLRVAARIPAERTANANPFLAELQASFDPFEGPALALGTCASGSALTMRGGDQLNLFPLEAEGARQDYFAPALDLTFRMFTESLTYQWLATAGGFAEDTTGGTTDPFGNAPPLGTSWVSPVVSEPRDVQLWVIQRDERFGATVFPTCITVEP